MKSSKKLKVLAEPNRIRILKIMFEGQNFCVSKIAKKLKLDLALVSYHLQVLAKTGWLKSRRQGKTVCYKLKNLAFIKDFKKVINKC
jgi:DNA-binding transcriptional ArsR family regulator